MRVPLSLMTILSSLTLSGWGHASDSSPMIGYRHDFTGVYPADCNPVTQWNEMDFKLVPAKDRHGKDIKVEAPDKERPVNIVWKTALNNFCVGGMIMVKGKLYQLVDRGGIGYAKDIVPDFVGPLLVCMDPANGKILWKKELHHLDKIEGVDPQKARETILAYCKTYVDVYSIHSKFYGLANQINKKKTLSEKQKAYYANLAKQYQAYIPDIPLDADAAVDNEIIKGMRGYVQTSFWKVQSNYLKEQGRREKLANKWGYNWNAWFGNQSFVGAAMPTPITDGESIWIHTAYNDAFCVDLDGNIKWCNWYGPQGKSWGSYITSTVVHDGVMITHHGTGQHKNLFYRGVDAASGEKLWTCTYPTAKSYHMITPAPMTLQIGDSNESVSVIWTGSGNVIRVKDGAIIGKGLGVHANARPFAFDGKDTIVINNGSSEGGAGSPVGFKKGLCCIKLHAESADKVTGTLIWNVPPKAESRLVIHNGAVFGFGRDYFAARDMSDGTILGKVTMPRKAKFVPQHLGAIVANHYFALHGNGKCAIYNIADPKTPTFVNMGRLGMKNFHHEYGAFNQGAQAFFSGNRIFMRSYTDVYCVGDPSAAMTLSKAHQ